jgi:hypothetical protein
VGVHLLVAGLASQLLTIMVFATIVAIFYRRTCLEGMIRSEAPTGWKRVLKAIIISIVLITVGA